MKLHGVLVDFHRAGSRRYATTGKKCIPNFCEKKYCFQHSCNNSAMLPKDWGLMIEERCKKRFDHHLYITYMQSYNSKFGINTMLMTQCTESKLAPPGKKNTQLYICKICRLVLLWDLGSTEDTESSWEMEKCAFDILRTGNRWSIDIFPDLSPS